MASRSSFPRFSLEPIQGLDALVACPIPTWKRCLDIAGALCGLAIGLPFLLPVVMVIKIVSKGPILFKQERVGYGKQRFTCLKLRTMVVNADSASHQQYLNQLIHTDLPMTKLDATHDPRIIPFGHFLRKSCLDEVPQLLNVLRGEMSLVGPRPCLPYELELYQPWHIERFDVLPGMTGLWQVEGKNRSTFSEMMRLDIRYARRYSLILDLKIMLRTLPAIVMQVRGQRGAKPTHATP